MRLPAAWEAIGMGWVTGVRTVRKSLKDADAEPVGATCFFRSRIHNKSLIRILYLIWLWTIVDDNFKLSPIFFLTSDLWTYFEFLFKALLSSFKKKCSFFITILSVYRYYVLSTRSTTLGCAIFYKGVMRDKWWQNWLPVTCLLYSRCDISLTVYSFGGLVDECNFQYFPAMLRSRHFFRLWYRLQLRLRLIWVGSGTGSGSIQKRAAPGGSNSGSRH